MSEGPLFRRRTRVSFLTVVGAVCASFLLLLTALPGSAYATSSPVKELNIGLSDVMGFVNSVTTNQSSDKVAPNYVMYYSFTTSHGENLTGNFSLGSGCAGGCHGASYPFLANVTTTMKFWLMDNQTVSGKTKFYAVYINGKSDSFSLTVYGTDTAYWCIKALEACAHTYNLTGTTTSSVPRSANVSLAVSESSLLSFQASTTESLYSNYTGVFNQLTQSCPVLAYNQNSINNLIPLILLPFSLVPLPVPDADDEYVYAIAAATGISITSPFYPLVPEFLSSLNSWNASMEFPNGVPNLPFLCENMYYTMFFADGGNVPPIYYDLQDMMALIATEQGLLNSAAKLDNATLLSNLKSQNSTISQAMQDLSGLNSTLYSFVEFPSSCQVYYGGWDGYDDGPCAPYAEYLITTFMIPIYFALDADQTYTSGTIALLSHSK